MWRATIIIFAALASCAIEAPSQEVETRALAIQDDDPNAEEVASELIRLYQGLVARLDARGVTLEELQAAVDAGDAKRVRELFGFTPEEFEAANARARAVAAMFIDVMNTKGDPDGEVYTEGLRCEWGIFECGGPYMIAAWAMPAYGAALLIAGSVFCGISRCHWDDGGSGPRTKQK